MNVFTPPERRLDRHDTARAAVVSLPVLPLQLLWRKRPSWRSAPVATVADETPDAPLLLLSRAARQRGLQPGMRQGAARNLVPELRTAVVAESEIQALAEELVSALQTFSPRVEHVLDNDDTLPEELFPGAFFVDPRGLGRLYGGMENWAATVHHYLLGRGLIASVVVGFARYRTLVVAKASDGAKVLRNPAEEKRLSDAVPLRQLGFPERLCDPLGMLGIDTLGAFLELPPGELMTRFGKDAAALHALFSDQAQLPMQPRRYEAPRRVAVELSRPDVNLDRLMNLIEDTLPNLIVDLEGRGERLVALKVRFELERYGQGSEGPRVLADEERVVEEEIEPADATNHVKTLMELVRLRFAKREVPAPVEQLVLEAEGRTHHGEQRMTPGEAPERDLAAAGRALARLRARFGEDSVVRAQLREAHLPEAKFRYETISGGYAELVGGHGSQAANRGAAVRGTANRGAANRGASPATPKRSTRARRRGATHSAKSAGARRAAKPSSAKISSAKISGAKISGATRHQESAELHHRLIKGDAGDAADPLTLNGAPRLELPQTSTLPRQRRLLTRPRALSGDAAQPKLKSPVVAMMGPHKLNGGWWGKTEGEGVERDYYYARCADGSLAWVYFDGRRARWYLQGWLD